tara:strand:+ start:1004 stop:1153 length:150 start_codon:yes stop_codon:yes gene_type:complete
MYNTVGKLWIGCGKGVDRLWIRGTPLPEGGAVYGIYVSLKKKLPIIGEP